MVKAGEVREKVYKIVEDNKTGMQFDNVNAEDKKIYETWLSDIKQLRSLEPLYERNICSWFYSAFEKQ